MRSGKYKTSYLRDVSLAVNNQCQLQTPNLHALVHSIPLQDSGISLKNKLWYLTSPNGSKRNLACAPYFCRPSLDVMRNGWPHSPAPKKCLFSIEASQLGSVTAWSAGCCAPGETLVRVAKLGQQLLGLVFARFAISLHSLSFTFTHPPSTTFTTVISSDFRLLVAPFAVT